MNGRLFNGLIVALCALILTGAGLSAYFISHLDRREIVRLTLREEKEETVFFEDLSLLPGEGTSYVIALSSDVKGGCDVHLSFRSELTQEDREDEEIRSLAEFLCVRITEGERLVCDQPLYELLDKSSLVLEKFLLPNAEQDLTVTYYIPQDVGNEAQGADVSFLLAVRASNITEE